MATQERKVDWLPLPPAEAPDAAAVWDALYAGSTDDPDLFVPVQVRLERLDEDVLRGLEEPGLSTLDPLERRRLLRRIERKAGPTDAVVYVVQGRLRAFPYEILSVSAPVRLSKRGRRSARAAISGAEPPVDGPVAAAAAVAQAVPAAAPGVHAIVAVIDDAIPYLHARFRAAPDRTRFEAVWLQSREDADPTDATALGRVIEAAEIDARLAAPDEGSDYAALNAALYPLARRPTLFARAHGAHVADLACGAAFDDPVFRHARLLGVQVPPQSIQDTSGRRFENYVLLGLNWIVDRALEIVEALAAEGVPADAVPHLFVNVSLGALAGRKDGLGPYETALLGALRDYAHPAYPGLTATLSYAYGNAARSRQVAATTLAPGAAEALDWRVQPADRTASYVEVRASAGAQVRVTLTPPPPLAGLPLPLDLGAATGWALIGPDGPLAAAIPFPDETGGAARRVATLVAAPTDGPEGRALAPAGAWRIVVENRGAAPAQVSLQVQRDDTPDGYRPFGRQSYLDHPEGYGWDDRSRDWTRPAPPVTRDASHAPHCVRPKGDPATELLIVGSAVGRPTIDAAGGAVYVASIYAAQGGSDDFLTRSDGPDLAAVGDEGFALPGVRAAGVLSGANARLSGTSMAAPKALRARVAAHVRGRVGLPPDAPAESAPTATPPSLGARVLLDPDPEAETTRVTS